MSKMTMIAATALAATTLALLAVPVLASDDDRSGSDRRGSQSDDRGRCAARSDAEWMPIEQVAQKLKDQGYTVRKVERSHGCYEVKATDGNGVRVEIYVDPATAQIVSRESRS